ncbi:hypothetical protein [Robiginitalea marina]|uniref:DUF4136 domain-containing protein n=1 Tax=Robiginitalea marina TaxID=2954105 RepID=A0ABT1B250_9FLAO|nr:hypothetical protein [Robiginitalea marina]MCO5726059.1 hypothetical protein [Robiginitalea marina]
MKKYSIFLLIAMLVTSCATTYLTNSRNFSQEKRAYDKIVVIGISKSRVARAQFEQEVVNGLAAQGVNAISSNSSGIDIPMEGTLSDSQASELNQKLMQAGFDGAIITHLVNASEYTDVIPGNTYTGYYPVRYGRFGRYASYYPVQTWEPDRMVTGTKYVLESCLYALDNGQDDNLQWVGMFELKDPSNLQKVTEKYAGELTEALLKESIAPR